MLKKITVALMVGLLIPFAAQAQNANSAVKYVAKKQAKLLIDAPGAEKTAAKPGVTAPASVKSDNWVIVDTMGNAFGAATPTVRPLVFDPASGVLALVHRGGGATTYPTGYSGSGYLWYNYSTDFGKTWVRSTVPVNGSVSAKGRYPGMAISNPTGGDISKTTAFFAWPQLNAAGTFGDIGYAADQPLANNAPYAVTETPAEDLYSSDMPAWASDNSPWMFWATRYQTDNIKYTIFRTQDFVTVEKVSPPQFDDTSLYRSDSPFIYLAGAASRNGVQYIGEIGTFKVSDTLFHSVLPAYATSTDNGATWSNLNIVDFRKIPAIKARNLVGMFDSKTTDASTLTAEADLNVDKNGFVHFIFAAVDTIDVTDGVEGKATIVEVYQTSATTWDAKILADKLPDDVYGQGPGLGQIGAATYLATNKAGDILLAQWAMPPVGKTNIPWLDVYQSYRTLNGEWSTPVNITNSDSINNSETHLARYLAQDGNKITAFSFSAYVSGATGPYTDSTLATTISVSANTYTVAISGVNDTKQTVNTFELNQNYPNPFNPSTSIKYSVPSTGKVVLKVYDILGKEVATLVNEVKNAGAYNVTFDASKLASGMYIYSINAGQYTSAKKMMLLK
jgi:hypothetical protein